MRNSMLATATFLCALLYGVGFSTEIRAGDGACRPTEENIEGPYYLPDAPFREKMAPEGMQGDRLEVSGRVLAHDCVTPLAEAVIDVWQTDSSGRYDFSEKLLLRGRVRTDRLGRYRFETLLPGRYRTGSTYRPAHIHLRASHPGGKDLVTQIYFKEDPFIPTDPFVHPSLVVPLEKSSRDGREIFTATFDIVLDRP